MPKEKNLHFHPTRILVPIDFSNSATMALDAAEDLAEEYGAELDLLHIVPMFRNTMGGDASQTFFPEEEYLREMVARAEKRLEALAAALSAQGLRSRCSVETGDDVIGNMLRVIERDGIDMVVISTHGMTGWRPTIFGSIAEKILKLAPCPVLLLRTAKTIELPGSCVEAETEVAAA